MADDERVQVFFSGHVQGVGFRFTTVNIASRYAVTGFVRNLRDGRVEVVAEGQPKDLDAFVEAVQREMARHVTDVSKRRAPATGKHTRFSVAY